MKSLTFKYTKKDGSTSERTLLAMITPSDKYAGIDVSELSADEAAEFMARAQTMHDEFIEDLQALQEEFDLKHSYRQFFATGMSEIVEI